MGKILKVEKKHHGTVDKSSLEQQFRKSEAITFVVCMRNLEPYS